VTNRQEDQNVTLRLTGMNLENGGDCRVNIVCLWLSGIMKIDCVSTSRNYGTERSCQLLLHRDAAGDR
jgi:hypothetical protein